MSKILEAIEALAHNATHPKFLTEALTEIKGEFDALKERVEKLESKPAKAADIEGPETRAAIVALTPAPAPVAPAVPEVAPAAPVVQPVTA
jgi:hypothetical protein